LDDLKSFKISSVFIDGMEVGKDNNSGAILESYNYRSSSSVLLENTMHVKSLDNDYFFRIPGRGSWVQVIGVTPGQIITEKRILQAKYICSIGGGLAVAYNGQIIANLPLPIGGLMFDKPIESVIANLRKVNEVCKNLGNNVIRDPFMLLSFLSLSVIPSLKLTDKGLLDIEKFQLTNLWVQY
jgi:adenine deaminase